MIISRCSERWLFYHRVAHDPLLQAAARARFEQSTAELADFRTRFDVNRPNTWKRVALILFVLWLFWMALNMRFTPAKPPVEHAQKYSQKYKYRHAASPIVASKLPDTRTKLRGDDVGRAIQAERLARLNAPKKDIVVRKKSSGKNRN